MTKRMVIAASTFIILGIFLALLPSASYAATSVEVYPTAATSNSVFTLIITWTGTEDDFWPDDLDGDLTNGGDILISGPGGFFYVHRAYYDDPYAHYSEDGNSYIFHVRISSGLRFSSINSGIAGTPHPEDSTIKHLPGLYADFGSDPIGEPKDRKIKVISRTVGSDEDDESEVTVTIHDSHDGINHSTGIYSGVWADRDYLWGYEEYGDPLEQDPINTTRWNGLSPDDSENPDDGTSSSIYTFKVQYHNRDGLPPQEFLGKYQFSKLSSEERTGVVLYIGYQDVFYTCFHPMQPKGGANYEYIREPRPCNNFVALPVGRYSYFFRTSDDYIRVPSNLSADKYGDVPYWLDPFRMAGNPDDNHWYVPDPFNLEYRHLPWPRDNFYDAGSGGVYDDGQYDPDGIYVDAPTYQPGVRTPWTASLVADYWLPYPFPATEHPVVSLGLYGPDAVIDGVEYSYDGYLPWRGVVTPYRRAVNPETGWNTAGVAQNTPVDFQILYAQLEGILPEDTAGGEISLWINDGNDDSTPYTKYALARVTDEPGDVTSTGLLYRTSTAVTLSPGPHTFYFTASDGERYVRFPVYGSSGINYQTGPYVNTRAVLTNPRVDPPIGTAGDNFRFSVEYTDADNQRPFQQHVIVQWRDGGTLENGGAVRMTMTKLDPTDTDYTDGCTYYFDSANLAHKLQPGERKFYFEFIDDWGAPTDHNDRIAGETVWYMGAPNWIDGPYVSANHRPVLTDGEVISPDGTANSATLWTYKVKYTDSDNHAPKFVNLIIGQVAVDGSIIWDDGYAMQPSNPSDNIYSDGKEYSYSTTLSGGDPPNSYMYCIVASDGIDMAQYDAVTSPSANAVWWTDGAYEDDPGTPGERLYPVNPPFNTTFTSSFFPFVRIITSDPPDLVNMYSYPIVYDDAGTELLYDPTDELSGDYTIDYANGVITLLNGSSTYADVQYLFGVPGPNSVGSNTPPALDSGMVTPDPGSSTDTFTFSVIYSDQDGPSGQAPFYVRVKVDGIEYAMSPVQTGVPNYKVGARYTVAMNLTPGVHRYYFETSDGAGYAIYDSNGNRSSSNPIIGYVPIVGPYVNDLPTLTEGTIDPNPTGDTIDVSQSITYSVKYTDVNNEAPNAGYPVAYIDNALDPPDKLTEDEYSGTATSVGKTTLRDSSQSWITDQFKGLPVQMTSGAAQGTVYVIDSNTIDTLTLLATDLAAIDGIQIGDTFNIGKIILLKTDQTDNDYTNSVTYAFTIPGLGEGTHSAHFKSVTTEIVGNNDLTRDSIVRTEEITGPDVDFTAPPGNSAPVLTDGAVNPTSGTASTPFRFGVTYTDIDGDPPVLHDNILGYVKLVIDGVPYDMYGPALPNYVTGADFEYPDPSGSGVTLTGGTHQYHFEASDGYFTTRLPSAGEYTVQVNERPTLTEDAVTPETGNWGRPYTYSVKYTDVNGSPPYGEADGIPQLWIDGTLIERPAVDDPDPVYTVTDDGASIADGRTYSYTLKRFFFEGEPGVHTFQFKATDGEEAAVDTTVQSAPTIHDNFPPEVSLGAVTPTSGLDGGSFIYSVVYGDIDGDEPEYVILEIDGGGDDNTFLMTKSDQPGNDDFTAGVTYTYTKVGLPIGNHSFVFTASDWISEVSTEEYTGPYVTERPDATITVSASNSSPYVNQQITISGTIEPALAVGMRVIITDPDAEQETHNVTSTIAGTYAMAWTPDAVGTWKIKTEWDGNQSYGPSESPEIEVVVRERPVATITVGVSEEPTIGQQINIIGQITPAMSVNMTVRVTKGTQVTNKQVTSAADGTYTTTWTPDVTGDWKIKTIWAGDNDYEETESSEITVEVTGPSATFSGLNMISIPLSPTTGFVDGVFGINPPYAIAKWIPALGEYKIYSWLPGGQQDYDFPLIALGEGYWIKTLQAKTVSPEGTLASTSQSSTKALGVGWNQVGCPFTQAINWSSLKISYNGGTPVSLTSAAANGWVREYGWMYDQATGNYKLVDAAKPGAERTMEPWKGYWMKAMTGCQLVVSPPIPVASEGKAPTTKSMSTAGYIAPDWSVSIIARNGQLADETNYFGIGPVTEMIESPACLEGYVDLYFTNNGEGRYAGFIRSRTDESADWAFTVTTDTPGIVELTWDGLETIYPQSILVLTDEADGTTVEMLPDASYSFNVEQPSSRSFRIKSAE